MGEGLTELHRCVLGALGDSPKDWFAPKAIALECEIRPKWGYDVAEYLVRIGLAEKTGAVDDIPIYRITTAGIAALEAK